MTIHEQDHLKARRCLVEGSAAIVEPMPAGAVELAKVAIADGLGVAVGGSRTETSMIARSVLPPVDGGVSCWGDGTALTPADAAFANAVTEHSLDWDDYMHPMHGHGTTVLLPACGAVAEMVGASGRELVEAYLFGYEVDGRVSLAVGTGHYEKGWHSTSTVGVVGAAAAAARLLGLGPDATWHAMGVAASSAAGLRVNFGTRTKALHAGNAARNAVLAALLVRGGVTANPEWLLGRGGYVAMFGDLDLAGAVESLSSYEPSGLMIEGPWGLVLKPYPCCGSSHAAAQAMIELMTENDLSLDDVVSVDAQVDPLLMKILLYDRPKTTFEAQYSLRYTLAAACTGRQLGVEQFDTATLHRPEVQEVMSKIRIRPDLQNTDADRFRAVIGIETPTGTVTREVRFALGHPNAPMSAVDRRRKFDLAAAPVLGVDGAADLYEELERLETVPRWADVAARLCAPGAQVAGVPVVERAG